jgi:shikimate dehydrogenase
MMAGTANTLLFDGPDAADGTGDGSSRLLRGFNTDVAGIVRALAAAGLTRARSVHILGGGATAASAMVAAAELGAEQVLLSVRSLERSAWLEPLAHSLGLAVGIRPLAHAGDDSGAPELVISTLPGGVDTGAVFPERIRSGALLLDVAYDPWPSALARSWEEAGGRVLSGLAMLVHQALLQVRIFVSGDPLQPLDDEDGVLTAMLHAVGLSGS